MDFFFFFSFDSVQERPPISFFFTGIYLKLVLFLVSLTPSEKFTVKIPANKIPAGKIPVIYKWY